MSWQVIKIKISFFSSSLQDLVKGIAIGNKTLHKEEKKNTKVERQRESFFPCSFSSDFFLPSVIHVLSHQNKSIVSLLSLHLLIHIFIPSSTSPLALQIHALSTTYLHEFPRGLLDPHRLFSSPIIVT
jgi:hypothetical protein